MPSRVRAVCVDPKRINEIWPHVRALIEAAIKRTGLSAFCDVEDEILCGDGLLWLAWDGDTIKAAASTSLQVTDAGLVCVLTACGGHDMHEWLPLLADIETYAKAEKCRCVRIFGRKGWAKVLNDYAVKNVVLDKELR